MNTIITEYGSDIEISGLSCCNISQIFDCGQTFRFDPDDNGNIRGIAHGRELVLSQTTSDKIVIHNMNKCEFDSIWRKYLALDDDYDGIRSAISESCSADTVIIAAMECGNGIRILHQDPWETLCSFIISQNNNIPRQGNNKPNVRTVRQPRSEIPKHFTAFRARKVFAVQVLTRYLPAEPVSVQNT